MTARGIPAQLLCRHGHANSRPSAAARGGDSGCLHIGGGYTGLSAALHCAERGLSVVLLEAHKVGFGASGRNGGQVGSGQRQDQVWLEKTVGRDDARRLWDLSQDAKALVRDLIDRHRMPVTFHPGIAHACWSDAEVRETHLYAEKLHRDYGYDQLEPLDRAGIQRLIGSRVYKGGEVDRGAGHLHPLNFALGLAQAAVAAGARCMKAAKSPPSTMAPDPLSGPRKAPSPAPTSSWPPTAISASWSPRSPPA